jgi:cytochrome bd-type quinol oxidase subunit 2
MILLVFGVVAAIVVTWLALVASAWLSWRWTRRSPERRARRRLVMALVPVVVGTFLLNFHLRFQFNGPTMNLSWPFALPVGIGVLALYCWLRARRGEQK